jgi:hypothetical protein
VGWGHDRRPLAAALIVVALGATACGGRFTLPPASTGGANRAGTAHTDLGGTASTSASNSAGLTLPTLPPGETPSGSSSSVPVPRTTVPSTGSAQKAIADAYETYLYDLSGLDDTLSKAYIGPLASVTTNRLAQASVRQAAAILAAQEHGVGTLRDDHMTIAMTGSASAALADCQDQEHFYLVSDDSDTPDPFVARGYFVGSAQFVLQDGHWLVDTFTTTHVPCTF